MQNEYQDPLIQWQDSAISRAQRSGQKSQEAQVIWLTGLSGSGKTTLANALEKRLFSLGKHTYLLDGDNIRHGICSDLTFSEPDRLENNRRVGEIAKLMFDAGLIIICAMISPFRAQRDALKKQFPAGRFIEIYVDTPLAVCKRRDPKGLYEKARFDHGILMTGDKSIYEAPIQPDLVLQGDALIDDNIEQIIKTMTI